MICSVGGEFPVGSARLGTGAIAFRCSFPVRVALVPHCRPLLRDLVYCTLEAWDAACSCTLNGQNTPACPCAGSEWVCCARNTAPIHASLRAPRDLRSASHRTRHVVFTLGDARSFSGLTSKIPPLGRMLNFDADVKTTSPM